MGPVSLPGGRGTGMDPWTLGGARIASANAREETTGRPVNLTKHSPRREDPLRVFFARADPPSGKIFPGGDAMRDHAGAAAGTPLRNSLWNLLYRVVSSTDHSRTAWGAILRGACLAFFKETIDDLPTADNEAARRALEEERAPVRLLRDRFLPLPDELALDAVATAEEKISLFDLAAAARHLQTAVAFLSRRPDPAAAEAVREAVIAVAAVVRTLAGGAGEVAMGTAEPAALRLGIPPGLREGIEAMLGYCHSASGLPGSDSPADLPDLAEATCLVVFCSSVISLLLSRAGEKARE